MNKLTCSVCFPIVRLTPFLTKAFGSCFNGLIAPSQLIVVDQSFSDDLRTYLDPVIQEISLLTEVIYIKSVISGLVYAKQLGSFYCTSEILAFGEDDLIFDNNYIDGLITFFAENPTQLGACAMIKELDFSRAQNIKFWLSSLSPILYDSRQWLSRFSGSLPSVVPSIKLYGGSSAWRLSTLREIPFQPNLTLHFTEDIFYSMLVNKVTGYPCTSILTSYYSMHYSVTNRFRYSTDLFRQRVYEEFSLIAYFQSSIAEAAWAYFLLYLVRQCEILFYVPLFKKFTLTLVLFFSFVDSFLPPYRFRAAFSSFPFFAKIDTL